MSALPKEVGDLYFDLLDDIQKIHREKRMASPDVSTEEIRRAPDLDLAARLRLKREKK